MIQGVILQVNSLQKNNNVDQLLYYWKNVKSTDTLRLIVAGDGPQMN